MLRRQAIKMRERGMAQKEIAELLGVHKSTVCTWCTTYEREGEAFFAVKKPGKKKGTGKRLTAEQEKQIQNLIIDKTPNQLRFDFALWNRKAVKLLIEQQFEIVLSIRAVGDYLKRWGFTPQKPLRRAYAQDSKKVKKWLEEEYPAIKERAKEEGAEIHWGDETGLRNDTQHGRGYSPKGVTPVQRMPVRKESVNLISSITNQGKVRFMGYRGSMNAALLITFFEKLTNESTQKIFLILDNLRVHHSKLVKDWLKEHKEKIEVFYLPSYSPELNPDEYLNCDLKDGVHSKTPAKSQEELEKKTHAHMEMLQASPDRVKSYFRHQKIAYAADDDLAA